MTLFSITMMACVVLLIYSPTVHGVDENHIVSAHGMIDKNAEEFTWKFDLNVQFYSAPGRVIPQADALLWHKLLEEGDYESDILKAAQYKPILTKGSSIKPHYASWGYEWPATSGIIAIIEAKDGAKRTLQLVGEFPEFSEVTDPDRQMIRLSDIAEELQQQHHTGTIHWLACRDFAKKVPAIASIGSVFVPLDYRQPWETVQRRRWYYWRVSGVKTGLLNDMKFKSDHCFKFSTTYDEESQEMLRTLAKYKIGVAQFRKSGIFLPFFKKEKKDLAALLEPICRPIMDFDHTKLNPFSSSLDLPPADKIILEAASIFWLATAKPRCKLWYFNSDDDKVFKFYWIEVIGAENFEQDLKDEVIAGRHRMRWEIDEHCEKAGWTRKSFGIKEKVIESKSKSKSKKESSVDPEWAVSSSDEAPKAAAKKKRKKDKHPKARVGLNNQLLNDKYMWLVDQIDLLHRKRE
eukprot:454139_1